MTQAARDRSSARGSDTESAGGRVYEIRLVGRGGQGVVTAGELLGRAALDEGRYAQSLPTFGPERRGALSQATLRLGDREILLKCTAARPDVVLVLDPTIWHHANVFLGVREGATLVFNSAASPEEIERDLRSGRLGYSLPVERYRIVAVDATGIALKTMGRAITNTAMMGAFSGATGLVGMGPIEEALAERFGARAPENVEAARAARERLTELDRTVEPAPNGGSGGRHVPRAAPQADEGES